MKSDEPSLVVYLCNMSQGGLPRSALVTHRSTYALPRCMTSQHLSILYPLSISLWKYLADSVFDDVTVAGSRAQPMFFMGLNRPLTLCVLLFSRYILSFYKLELFGWSLQANMESFALSRSCITYVF